MRIRQLAEHILNKNLAGGLSVINNVAVDGVDLRQFNRGLVDYLRDLLLVKSGAGDSADLPTDTVKEIKQLVSHVSLGEISKTIRLFAQADFRADPQSTLPLELALVDSSLAVTEKPKKALPEKKADVEPKTSAVQPPKVEVIKERGIVPPVTTEPPATKVATATKQTPPQNIEQIRQRWSDFINACRGAGSAGTLDALLRKACEAVALEGDTLVLGFYHDFHRSKIEDPKYRHLVEDKLRDVFGTPYHVRCVLTPKEKETKPQQRANNPVVNAALEMGARIIDEEHKHDE
jgi:DNA polymerase-3 subunit gamma/tau